MEEIKIRPGYIIKGYMLKEMVGAGGFSTVYKAETINPLPLYTSIIAVKVLHPRRLERQQIRQFIKEGKIVKNLEHPNIVKVFDIVQQDGNFFILMEFLDTDLLKAIRTKKEIFNEKNIIEVITKAAKGLAYIHKNGIVHKDINPSNILISYNLEKVKITDFGLAKRERFFMNKRDFMSGTEGYIPPERFEGKPADAKGDIYSFGKTIEKIYSELKFPMPEKIRNIVKIATDKNPDNRFESMEGIVFILETRKIE
ncbi:MAG: serine/threonine protein kinase [Candidatus Omnitrophica bacterium]|nr:serine/threonine protein kinase [Candidatus Omnitrophota bacterium]MCM8806457.1 serine/threonine protein kinase [Candidatus Omnitrophota bacterium]